MSIFVLFLQWGGGGGGVWFWVFIGLLKVILSDKFSPMLCRFWQVHAFPKYMFAEASSKYVIQGIWNPQWSLYNSGWALWYSNMGVFLLNCILLNCKSSQMCSKHIYHEMWCSCVDPALNIPYQLLKLLWISCIHWNAQTIGLLFALDFNSTPVYVT